MVYQRKTLPSIKQRNVRRRKQRQFRKMVRTHPVLIALCNIPEIARHFSDIEKVLGDFYHAGYMDGIIVMYLVGEKVLSGKFSQSVNPIINNSFDQTDMDEVDWHEIDDE